MQHDEAFFLPSLVIFFSFSIWFSFLFQIINSMRISELLPVQNHLVDKHQLRGAFIGQGILRIVILPVCGRGRIKTVGKRRHVGGLLFKHVDCVLQNPVRIAVLHLPIAVGKDADGDCFLVKRRQPSIPIRSS